MAVDLAKCLVSILAERVKIKGTVYHKIQSYLARTDHDYNSNISPQEYFRLGLLHHVKKKKKIHIETKIMPPFPTLVMRLLQMERHHGYLVYVMSYMLHVISVLPTTLILS